MMEYLVRTPSGNIPVTMWEYFALFERRLTLDQILLKRKMEQLSKT